MVFHFKWTMFSFLKTWFNFFYKRRAKELLLSSPTVKPASCTFALKQTEGTSGDKPQISTSHTNYRPSYHDILLTFCLSPTMKNRHSLNQNDSHGQFYKTNRRHRVSPPPPPTSPASPSGPTCSLFPGRQELIIRKTFPTADSDALLAKGPVCFEERVWQSKHFQKQL